MQKWLIRVMLLASFGSSASASDVYLDSLKSAAASGDKIAQLRLGEYYHRTSDPKARSLAEALKWYELAAEQGVAEAQDYLGMFYSGGVGGYPVSCEKSLFWYEKAALGGYRYSWGNLAWKLATCDDKSLRDGWRALEILKAHARELPESATTLDNWAAAWAEAGDFKKAAALQFAAITLIAHRDEEERLAAFNERLRLYKSHRTWSGASFENPASFR